MVCNRYRSDAFYSRVCILKKKIHMVLSVQSQQEQQENTSKTNRIEQVTVPRSEPPCRAGTPQGSSLFPSRLVAEPGAAAVLSTVFLHNLFGKLGRKLVVC